MLHDATSPIPIPTLKIALYCKLQISAQVSLCSFNDFRQDQERLNFIANNAGLMQCGCIRLNGNAKRHPNPVFSYQKKKRTFTWIQFCVVGHSHKCTILWYKRPECKARSLPKVSRILFHCVAPANFFKLGISESSKKALRAKRMWASSMS